MNWPEKIEQILSRGYTLKQIADECGFASKGAVHDLKSGESATCNYERGERLLRLHRESHAAQGSSEDSRIMRLVCRPPGRGRWHTITIELTGRRVQLDLFRFRVGEIIPLGQLKLRIVEVRP